MRIGIGPAGKHKDGCKEGERIEKIKQVSSLNRSIPTYLRYRKLAKTAAAVFFRHSGVGLTRTTHVEAAIRIRKNFGCNIEYPQAKIGSFAIWV